jgi:DNA-binding GntR family transcriptional regulator
VTNYVPNGTAGRIIYNIQCDEIEPTGRKGPLLRLASAVKRGTSVSVPVPVEMDLTENLAARRKPLKEEVFDVLHERILAGEYAAGQWLRQEEISSKLGVSMTPVREALDLLVSSGLAERVPYRGVRVLKPAAPEILNAYGVRLLLECSATYAAALHITEGYLERLCNLLEASRPLVRLEDLPRERALSRDLHSTIVASAGNVLLHRIYLTVLNTFPDWMLYEHLFRHPELLGESMRCEYAEHRLVVEALSARQPELAAQRAMEHVTNRGRELVNFLGIPAEQVQATEAAFLPLLMGSGTPGRPLQKETS